MVCPQPRLDGNKAWSAHETEADQEDSEKVQNAHSLYAKHNTRTMAETFCAVSGLDPLGDKISCNLPGDKRPKALNAAFPREDVEREVRTVLERHIGKLPKVDAALIRCLMEDWKALPCPQIQLPKRYGQILASGKRSPGGLLFGQLIPRFENRIIATCPITYERIYQKVLTQGGGIEKARHEADKLAKVPNKDCPEFLRYRWAMQVANIQVSAGGGRETRPLTAEERCRLDMVMTSKGALTKGEFKKAVREITGGVPDNLEQMLTHPDADEALILDPTRKAAESKTGWKALFPILPESLKKRALGQLRRGKCVRLGELLAHAKMPLPEVEIAIDGLLNRVNTKTKRGQVGLTREALLLESVSAKPLSGRAPYSRIVMSEAVKFVFSTDRHPTEECGPLYRSEAIRNAQLQRAIDEQTNNHLVRHRLLILGRLHRHILKEYASGDASRITRITIEVNRDLRELSGKDAKKVDQDQKLRLANFKSVTTRLEKAFEGQNIHITPGLIRKARIAEDLDWKCPYTGKAYDEFDLLHRKVDKDHIIPRSERASDSLDSLVITFAEVNRMKGNRTALRFIEECQGQTVEGKPDLSIKTVSNYLKDVQALKTFKGHDDDKRRKKRRKEMLELRAYVEKTFTPRDLTQTSQLVRLGAQLLEAAYSTQAKRPVIISLPGSVTGVVRKSWNLLGCLTVANPQVIDPETKEIHTKTEIRGITHLHHALDACVLGFASIFFPRVGGVWEMLIKRRLNPNEQKMLKERLRTYVEFTQDGQPKLIDLPVPLKNQITQKLAERRVVQHQSSDMSGLACDQTIWRVYDPEDKHRNSQRLGRWLRNKNIPIPANEAKTAIVICRKRRTINDAGRDKKVLRETATWRWVFDIKDKTALIGLFPEGDVGKAKLKTLKAVKILGDNFGIALDPEPTILRPHRIWHQIEILRNVNGGKRPRVLRIGSIIRINERTPRSDYRGVWMVRGVQLNQKAGFLIDLSPCDQIAYRGVSSCFQNVSLTTLLKCRLETLDASYLGVPSF